MSSNTLPNIDMSMAVSVGKLCNFGYLIDSQGKKLNKKELFCMSCRCPGITCFNDKKGGTCEFSHDLNTINRVKCKNKNCKTLWKDAPWLCPLWHEGETTDEYKERHTIENPETLIHKNYNHEKCVKKCEETKDKIIKLQVLKKEKEKEINKGFNFILKYTIALLIETYNFWKNCKKDIEEQGYDYIAFWANDGGFTSGDWKRPYEERTYEEQKKLKDKLHDDEYDCREVDLENIHELFENRKDEVEYYKRFQKEQPNWRLLDGGKGEQKLAIQFRREKLRKWEDEDYEDLGGDVVFSDLYDGDHFLEKPSVHDR